MSNDKNFFSGFVKAINTNAPSLLTLGSLLGIGLTIYCSYKASKNAAEEKDTYEESIAQLEETHKEDIENAGDNEKNKEELERTYKEDKSRLKFKHVVNLVIVYRWCIATSFFSGACALLSNWLNGHQILGLTALAAATGDKWKIAGKKVKEMVGEDKFKALQDSINKEFALKQVESGKHKVEVSPIKNLKDAEEGCKVYLDTVSGGFIEINPGILKDAIARAERHGAIDYATFRGYMGLYGPCMLGYNVCWTEENPFKATAGHVDLGGDIGIIDAIIYDNEPEFNKFGK